MWKKVDTITIVYFPGLGIAIDGRNLNWGEERKTVQKLLGNEHTSDDKIIDLSIYYDGDTKFNIIQRRDIYKNLKKTGCFLFLNYDEKDELRDLEVHGGCTIKIRDISISFNDSIEKAAKKIQSISQNMRSPEPGEFFFKDIKLTIANEQKMGGDGNQLAYFYCSSDISHLEDK